MKRMRFSNKLRLGLALAAVLLLFLAVVVYAQVGGYDLSWYTLDGGGTTSAQGGGYALNGTIGQPDAGVHTGGGGYAVSGGFWTSAPSQSKLYLPLIRR